MSYLLIFHICVKSDGICLSPLCLYSFICRGTFSKENSQDIHILAIVDNTEMNIRVHIVFFNLMFLNNYLEVE